MDEEESPVQEEDLFDQTLLGTKLSDSIDRLSNQYPEFGELLEWCQSFGPVLVFGGFVRDVIHNLFNLASIESRDIDLVIVGVLPQEIGRNGRTHFGGRRRQLSSRFSADFWELSSTYAFRMGLLDPSPANLLRSTVYTANACYFDLQRGQLREYNAVRDIRRKMIVFNCKGYLGVYPEFQAYRAIELSLKLGYGFERDVASFIGLTLKKSGVVNFISAVREHRPELDPSRLEKTYFDFASRRREPTRRARSEVREARVAHARNVAEDRDGEHGTV